MIMKIIVLVVKTHTHTIIGSVGEIHSTIIRPILGRFHSNLHQQNTIAVLVATWMRIKLC